MSVLASSVAAELACGATACRYWWYNIKGKSVSDLTTQTKYKQFKPDKTEALASGNFEVTSNTGDNLGAMIEGYIKPTTTGNYIFWTNSDDASEVWAASQPNTKNGLQKVVELTGCCQDVKGTKQLYWTAGKLYYIMGLVKEGGGGDHLRVGMQGPVDKNGNGGVKQFPIPIAQFAKLPSSKEYNSAKAAAQCAGATCSKATASDVALCCKAKALAKCSSIERNAVSVCGTSKVRPPTGTTGGRVRGAGREGRWALLCAQGECGGGAHIQNQGSAHTVHTTAIASWETSEPCCMPAPCVSSCHRHTTLRTLINNAPPPPAGRRLPVMWHSVAKTSQRLHAVLSRTALVRSFAARTASTPPAAATCARSGTAIHRTHATSRLAARRLPSARR